MGDAVPDRVGGLEVELDRIAGLLATLDEPDWQRPVPACPGWSVSDLVGHLGGIHRWVVVAVRDGHGRDAPPAPPAQRLADWFDVGARELRAELAVDPQAPAWSFHPPLQVVAFWQRRQLHEHVVHRVDLEQALGLPVTPVPAEVAADGLAEVVEVLLPRRLGSGRLDPLPAAIALRCTDTGDRVVLGDGEPAAELSGAAADLYLALWKRRGSEGLVWSGDAALGRQVFAMPLSS